MATTSNITSKVIHNLGTTETDLVSVASNQHAACVGLSLCNTTTGVVQASIMVEDATAVKGYYIKDVEIAPQSSLRVINGGEKLLLSPSTTVSVVSNVASSIDVIFSLVIITTI